MSREIITCTCGCGRTGPIGHQANQWITACVHRWRAAGRPDTGPPPLLDPAEIRARSAAASQARRAQRVQRARELAAHGVSLDAIAAEIGVSPKKTTEYLADTPTPADTLPPHPAMQEWRGWTWQVADRIATTDRIAPEDGWQDSAACLGQDVEYWVPDHPHHITRPREECAACPVRDDCLIHALTRPERYGIWASTTPDDRRILRRRISDLRHKVRRKQQKEPA